MAVALCVPALGIIPYILILVCPETAQVSLSLDVSHDFCLGKQFRYPLVCHFVWFLILHLKFISKLYLILCLLQPIETSQHSFNLRHNSAADSHTHAHKLCGHHVYRNGFVCAFSGDTKFTVYPGILYLSSGFHGWLLNVCMWLTNEDSVKVVPLIILFSLVYFVMLGSWPHSWVSKLTSYKMLI